MQNESKKQPKTKEELNALKEEVETLNRKLAELTEEELAEVSGGVSTDCDRSGSGGDYVTFTTGHSIPSTSSNPAKSITVPVKGDQEDHHYDKGILTIPIHEAQSELAPRVNKNPTSEIFA